MIDSCEAVTYVVLGVLLILGFIMLLNCSKSQNGNNEEFTSEGFRGGRGRGRGGYHRRGGYRHLGGPIRRWPRAYNSVPYVQTIQLEQPCEDRVKYAYDMCVDSGVDPESCRMMLDKGLSKCWFN